MGHPNELVIPPIALDDPKSGEILRAWVAKQGLHVSMHTNWKDPLGWGIALADIVRHLGNAYAEQRGWKKEDAVARVVQGLYAELGSPTDTPTGSSTSGGPS